MAQTNYTPISLYYSTTASAVPLAANLVSGELAININTADGKLYYKDSAGVVQLLAQKGGGIGTSSNTQILFNSGGSVAGSANLTFNGTTLTASAGVFTTATAIAAATQDAVALQGRAGGTSSYVATITPTTLTASRTLTIPDASGTILQSGTTVTVGQGGTGAGSFTANNVLLGNGTSAFQVVAPSTAGNVLTSNGTTWQSTAPAASGVSQAKATMISLIFSM
jgi:hypothetical protein